MVYCCFELGESSVSHCCLAELGLPDIFCLFRVVELCLCVLICFWLPFSLGIHADRFNIAGLLSLERSAYKIGLWLASENLDFGSVFTIS